MKSASRSTTSRRSPRRWAAAASSASSLLLPYSQRRQHEIGLKLHEIVLRLVATLVGSHGGVFVIYSKQSCEPLCSGEFTIVVAVCCVLGQPARHLRRRGKAGALRARHHPRETITKRQRNTPTRSEERRGTLRAQKHHHGTAYKGTAIGRNPKESRPCLSHCG